VQEKQETPGKHDADKAAAPRDKKKKKHSDDDESN
jgi:hypothetical protein